MKLASGDAAGVDDGAGQGGRGSCLTDRGMSSVFMLAALVLTHHPYQLPASGQHRASAPVRRKHEGCLEPSEKLLPDSLV